MAFEVSPDVGLAFWNLTLEEFAAIANGYWLRQGREWYRTAWLASYVLSGLVGKKAPKPEKLLGPEMMAILRPRRAHAADDEDDD